MNWFAMSQGREVFAVPGSMQSANSFGTNSLIKEGAKLVTNAEDIMAEISNNIKCLLSQDKKGETKEKDAHLLDKRLSMVYAFLSDELKHIDEIINETSIGVAQLSSILMDLQLRHLIQELPGKKFRRMNYG